MTNFKELNLSNEILQALDEMEFSLASPIQSKAIPILQTGKDIIGQAETGTGKTAAFAIPSIQLIDPSSLSTQILVLCPTRELVIQVAGEFTKLTKFIPEIKILPIYGGQNISIQLKALKGQAHVVIGTAGRILDHLRRNTLKLDKVKMVILDEADQMLDMGFREDIEVILEATPRDRQTVMFTATLAKDLMRLMEQHQKNPEHISTMSSNQQSRQIKQFYYNIKGSQKHEALKRLLQFHQIKSALIFCNTKVKVDELAKDLVQENFSTAAIHGDMDQRKRDKVMEDFRDGSVEILVATDVAARGIDVDNLSAVINYDLPRFDQDYVHRIGRTGRAGKEGFALTFIVGKELDHIQRIARKNNLDIQAGTVPSAKDLEVKQIETIRDSVHKINFDEKSLVKYKQLLSQLDLEGKDPELVPLILLKLVLDDKIKNVEDRVEFKPEEPSSREKGRSRSKPFRRDGGFSRGDSFSGNSDRRHSDRGDRREKSFGGSFGKATRPSGKHFTPRKAHSK